jgi:ankyrin repeat protein
MLSSVLDERSPVPACEVIMTPEIMEAIRADNPDVLIGLTRESFPHIYLVDSLGEYPPLFDSAPSLLSVCAYYGAVNCMEACIGHEVSVLYPDRRKRTAYHFAAAGGVVIALRRIIDQMRLNPMLSDLELQSQLLTPSGDGYTILHYAAQFDRLSILNSAQLIFDALSVFDTDTTGPGTPLHEACRSHSIKCFQFLADLNTQKIERNPLDQPYRDLPVNFNREIGPKTPLVLLLSANAFDLIPIGQTAGMDVDAPLSNGWSVIYHAIRQRSIPLVTALCKTTRAINWSCQMRWTAFHLAAQERCGEICRVLFKYGANPHLFTQYGFCPFLLAKPLHCRDQTRATAGVIRQILIEHFARLLMARCAKNLYESDLRGPEPITGADGEIPMPTSLR